MHLGGSEPHTVAERKERTMDNNMTYSTPEEQPQMAGEPIAAYATQTTSFNPVQLHLLKMFSYAKTSESFEDVRKSLAQYFAKRVEDDMDALWDNGQWSQEKNEALLREHI